MIVPIRRVGDGAIEILDQRKLPFEEAWIPCTTLDEVWLAIRYMAIRGAPAIGVAAAYGLALGARAAPAAAFAETFERHAQHMADARPTAVNLFWAIDRMRRAVARELAAGLSHAEVVGALMAEADAIAAEDLAQNRAIGAHGVPLLPPAPAHRPLRILTHCNTGSLATAGWGTALGVIRSAWEAGVRLEVYADETRPYLQGARLTAWELKQDGIPVTLIPDSAAGWLMSQGEIDVAIVGADRIALNGDTANKIGTYQVAVLCARHGLPFFVAAPTTTFDLTIANGSFIPIEERPAKEVLEVFGTPIAPSVPVRNPSFDVTPGELIAAIITEHGAARAPYGVSLPALAALGASAVFEGVAGAGRGPGSFA